MILSLFKRCKHPRAAWRGISPLLPGDYHQQCKVCGRWRYVDRTRGWENPMVFWSFKHPHGPRGRLDQENEYMKKNTYGRPPEIKEEG